MRDEIIEKIRKELIKPIKEECQVLCIMARIRKILEHLKNEENKKYPLLKLYCNWALHVKIDRTSPIRRFLEGAEDDFNKVLDFIYLEQFKKRLKDFLKEFDLSDGIIEDSKEWSNFTTLLHSILIDTPLIEPTDSIKEFSLKRLPATKEMPTIFSISWVIKYKNGSKKYGKEEKIT